MPSLNEEICPAKGHSPVHPSYPGGGAGANVSHIPYKTWRTVYMKKQKVFGSARRVTRLAWSLFFDSLVTS